MAQCKPDLSLIDCQNCLNNQISNLQMRAGESYYTPVCFIRHEIYPFFEGADSLPPTNVNNTGISSNVVRAGKNISSSLIIGIVAAAAAAVISAILSLVVMFLIMNNKVNKCYGSFCTARIVVGSYIQGAIIPTSCLLDKVKEANKDQANS
ncbi:cysteine-rich receptor-like protein kinase 18 [Spinacia oleracea]|uniref:Cysteine-rich receptor-like protein kinase 18 n=1 Tax=Spinacia oleracea TaxID=3562 RepID=A0ABM3QNZ1_SPIOL|nr:cysteine-rich receptor-like protein kinase 18 [Spinacia oleracea]